MSCVLLNYLSGRQFSRKQLTDLTCPIWLPPKQRSSVNRVLAYQAAHYPQLPLPELLTIDELAFLEWNQEHYISFFETGAFAAHPNAKPNLPASLEAFFLFLEETE